MRGINKRASNCKEEFIRHPNFVLKVYEDCTFDYRLRACGMECWSWAGKSDGNMFLLYLYRLAVSELVSEFISEFEDLSPENKAMLDRVVQQAKSNSEEIDSLIYGLLGDNACAYTGGSCIYDSYFEDVSHLLTEGEIYDVLRLFPKNVQDVVDRYLDKGLSAKDVGYELSEFMWNNFPSHDDIMAEIENNKQYLDMMLTGFDFSGVIPFIKSVRFIDSDRITAAEGAALDVLNRNMEKNVTRLEEAFERLEEEQKGEVK